MDRVRYGIDLDEVLRDFLGAFTSAMHFAPEPISNANMKRLREPRQYDVSGLVGAKNWQWFWQTGAAELRVFDLAYQIDGELENLAKLPGEIFIITSQPKHLRNQTYAWLAGYDAAPEGVLHVSHPDEKVEFINALGIDHFVDDRAETILNLIDKTDADLYIYDQPWNRDLNTRLYPHVTRIKSLGELL